MGLPASTPVNRGRRRQRRQSISCLTREILADNQTTCVNNCADKFLKHSERVGARFAEHNEQQMNKM